MRGVAAIALLATLAVARVASAEPPPLDHVVTAPTAWLPPANAVVVWGSVDQRGATSADAAFGLGGIAAVDLGEDHDVRACDGCGSGGLPPTVALVRAGFRVGARQDALFAGQPAIVLGTRVTLGSASDPSVSDLYVVASRVIGGLRLHAGLDAMDARAGGAELGAKLRPTLGLELTVAQYPRTTLMGDLVWVPRVDTGAPKLEGLGGWGVRYQTFAWAGVELVVRHRGGEGLDDSTVMVRVAGVWAR